MRVAGSWRMGNCRKLWETEIGGSQVTGNRGIARKLSSTLSSWIHGCMSLRDHRPVSVSDSSHGLSVKGTRGQELTHSLTHSFKLNTRPGDRKRKDSAPVRPLDSSTCRSPKSVDSALPESQLAMYEAVSAVSV
ncbi:hypothetical protein LIA77_03189 [Sarocladium implicatum]|nr:hypothetical protein LIA77_03189 [Sarocladium implicatum]